MSNNRERPGSSSDRFEKPSPPESVPLEASTTPDDQARLSQLSTQWSTLRDAHGDRSSVAAQARMKLIGRYEKAVFRYLIAATKDLETAEDLLQEFALRVMRGSFGNASSDRGKFRNYLRTTLINLVNENHRRRKRTVQYPGSEELAAVHSRDTEDFDTIWREELLSSAWSALKQFEEESGCPMYSLLRLRAEHPQASGGELTELWNRAANKDDGAASLRKSLQRAREKFASLLIDQISVSVGTADLDRVEAEICDLGLEPYCRRLIQQRRASRTG